MNLMSLFFISIGLAMDAFAVSLTEGISLKKLHIKHVFRVAIVFGVFQGIMPLIGWKLGNIFYDKIEPISHYIAFILLVFVGGKMVLDARKISDEDSLEEVDSSEINKQKSNIFILGIATSIDALVVGFSFSMLPGTNIYISIVEIGLVTFVLSALGVYIGNRAGQLLGSKAEYVGGVILIIMGIKSLF